MPPHNIAVVGFRTLYGALCVLVFATAPACALPPSDFDAQLAAIKLPEGFSIAVYARDVPGARSMALGPRGTVFVGTRSRGNVYALRDEDGDHVAESVRTIAADLHRPNGVAVRDGALYVAEIGRVLRYDGIEDRLDSPPAPVVVNDGLPADEHHGWKFIAFGPDGWLYVPVGAPCNICLSADERYASILRMRPDGTDVEVFAKGVRNTVGFDWQPGTEVLWFTDNGRDWLGEDQPPDELNRAPGKGMHFGYPHCHGEGISDPEFGAGHDCGAFTPPAQILGPHVAALGMRFYTGTMFPAEYRNQIFIAEHGSWNRTVPLGYRVMLVKVDGDRALSYGTFAEGWLRDSGKPWGRPVDVLVMADGALLVSDDYAGAIYRIAYSSGN